MRSLLAMALVSMSLRAADRPHIIVLLCDDLGTGDVRCFNPQSHIATPHLDRLAAQGLICTDAHSGSAVCTPTRYGLLTGRYCWRTPLQKGVLGGLSPRLIEPQRETIASYLKKQGYFTGCVGKWHLGFDWALKPGRSVTRYGIETPAQVRSVLYDQPIRNGPLSVGFDEYFGIAASLDMVPYAFIENDRIPVLPTDDRDFPMMTGGSARTRKGPASPGFEAEQVLPAFTRRTCEIITRQAKTGQPMFLYVPFASPHTATVPTKEWLGKSGLNAYADFVMQQDAAVGEIMTTLDKAGIAEKTLVIFTSDNGCSPQADLPALLAKGHNPNHVYRGHKADIYEGGHRVPFIVRWPKVITAGRRSEALIGLGDIFRTCAEIVQQPLPENVAEDSVSFLPVLRGEKHERSPLVHHSINGSFAIREGEWKLCFCPGSGGWSDPRPGRDDASRLPPLQLFHLASDIGETRNRVTDEPALVAKLTQMMNDYVEKGRSTPGPAQANGVTVNFRAAGEAAMKPFKK